MGGRESLPAGDGECWRIYGCGGGGMGVRLGDGKIKGVHELGRAVSHSSTYQASSKALVMAEYMTMSFMASKTSTGRWSMTIEECGETCST